MRARLFDKYLLACTLQRIPMPREWQSSMGLGLEVNKQEKVDLDGKGGASAEIVGYRFQQDDIIERGYVQRQVTSMNFTEDAKYLLMLYLEALRQHKGLDFTSYFDIGVAEYKRPSYVTRASVIRGKVYSIYGSTVRDVTIRLISSGTNEVFYERKLYNLSVCYQEVLDVQAVLNDWVDVQLEKFKSEGEPTDAELQLKKRQLEEYTVGIDEYYMIEVTANVAVQILPGAYARVTTKKASIKLDENGEVVTEEKVIVNAIGKNEKVEVAVLEVEDTAFTPHIALSDNAITTHYPVFYPSVVFNGAHYSDKLIPALLDMEIYDDSSPELISLLSGDLVGSTVAEKARLNTDGFYDIDQYLGGNLKW